MISLIFELNWLAVIVSLAANTILGGVWYTILFGRQYAKSLGREYNPTSKPSMIFIIGPMICGLLMIVAIGILITGLNIETLVEAVMFGLVVGLGIVASTCVNTAINPNIPRPLYYGIISGSFFVIITVIVSIIFVLLN